MMGSYSQVVVGGMLLVVAFFFGRYINQQPLVDKNNSAEQQELVGAFAPPASTATPNNSNLNVQNDEQSLRDRILSQRQSQDTNSSLPPVESLASAKNQPAQQQTFSDAIVVPDFSHLDAGSLESPIRMPKVNQQPNSLADTNADPLTLSNDGKNYVGKFSINRPDPERLLQQQGQFGKVSNSMAQRRSTARPVIEPTNDFNRKFARRQPTPRQALAADNPRYRMVPVRERVGKWSPEPTEYVNYTTVFGDTLHSLSTKFYGTPDRYLDIYLVNRGVFESPSEVPVNTEIRIPVMK